MNTTGEIRAIAPTDVELQGLDQRFFPRPWKSSDWNSIEGKHHRLLGLFESNRLIGFALFHVAPSVDTAHLLKILLVPEVRGSGKADYFWKGLLDSLKSEGIQKIYLEVEESNQRAQRFYERQRFQVLRRAKAYYSDGEGAVMMQLTL